MKTKARRQAEMPCATAHMHREGKGHTMASKDGNGKNTSGCTLLCVLLLRRRANREEAAYRLRASPRGWERNLQHIPLRLQHMCASPSSLPCLLRLLTSSRRRGRESCTRDREGERPLACALRFHSHHGTPKTQSEGLAPYRHPPSSPLLLAVTIANPRRALRCFLLLA